MTQSFLLQFLQKHITVSGIINVIVQYSHCMSTIGSFTVCLSSCHLFLPRNLGWNVSEKYCTLSVALSKHSTFSAQTAWHDNSVIVFKSICWSNSILVAYELHISNESLLRTWALKEKDDNSSSLKEKLYVSFWKNCIDALPLSVAIGRALSDLYTGNPFGLIYHSACVRQPPHVLYGHQHVVGILQDLHSLVMRNAPEATSIDLQNLIPYLQRWRQRDTPNETKWNTTMPGTTVQGPRTTGTCLKELPANLHEEISITGDNW